MPTGLEQEAGFEFKFAFPDLVQGPGQLVGRNRSQKAQAANVDTKNRSTGAGDLPRDAQHRAITAKDQQQIYLLTERGGVRTNSRFQLRQVCRDGITIDFAAGSENEPGSLFYGLRAG